MLIIKFSILDKTYRIGFFEENLLLADIGIDIGLGMFFLALNNVEI